jgi:phage head maturation protease
VKAGIVRGCSIGFSPLEMKPIAGVTHVTKAILHEISMVTLPALGAALVTERALDIDAAIEARLKAARRRRWEHKAQLLRAEMAAARREEAP